MIIQVKYQDKDYQCDLSKPIDLSVEVGAVNCFYAPPFTKKPLVAGDFVGSVKAGAPVNFFNIALNPHGNGTHTESLGHITKAQESVNQCLQQYHFIAQLVTINLTELKNGDLIIDADELEKKCPDDLPDALIIRTQPNSPDKLTANYSGKNPPYLSKSAMEFIVEKNVKHLLLDLPSVDREKDEGKLENHKLFWQVRNGLAGPKSRINHTITELIYVPDEVSNGMYLLNIQLPAIDLDAAPSRPVIFSLF